MTERKQRKTRQRVNKILVSKMADKLTERKQRKTRQRVNKILVSKMADIDREKAKEDNTDAEQDIS